MEVDHPQAQLLTPLHLISKGVPALLHHLLPRRAKVDQVTGMGEDILRLKAALRHINFKGFDVLFLQRLGEPLALVSCKEGKSIGTDLLRIQRSILHPTRTGDVRTDIFRHCDRD